MPAYALRGQRRRAPGVPCLVRIVDQCRGLQQGRGCRRAGVERFGEAAGVPDDVVMSDPDGHEFCNV